MLLSFSGNSIFFLVQSDVCDQCIDYLGIGCGVISMVRGYGGEVVARGRRMIFLLPWGMGGREGKEKDIWLLGRLWQLVFWAREAGLGTEPLYMGGEAGPCGG